MYVHVCMSNKTSDTTSSRRTGLVGGGDDELSVSAALDVDEGRPPGVGVVSVHQAPAQHRPRPGLEVREVGIPAERVRVEPAVPRPRGEAGERQAEAEPGPEDRLAPVGLSLPLPSVAPAVAPG